jgi:hypothetical protein
MNSHLNYDNILINLIDNHNTVSVFIDTVTSVPDINDAIQIDVRDAEYETLTDYLSYLDNTQVEAAIREVMAWHGTNKAVCDYYKG